MMLITLHLTGCLAFYILGRWHERRVQRRRLRFWPIGTALRQYAEVERPLDFDALRSRRVP